MLGMYLARDGNKKYQVKYMHKKATAWETSRRVGGVKKYEARKALNQQPPKQLNIPYLT